VPQSVAIGTAKVYVKRPQYLSNNGAWDQLVGKESNRVQLSYDARYIFGGLSGNQLLVIDSQSKDLAARIPIGGDYPAPRSVAISPDNTRAYATLRFESAVAVIDTVALQQLDADGNLANGVSNIELLPGARPFWIAVSKNGNKAYVSDEVAGRIYVLDIDPSSGSYNQLVRTLDVGPAPSGLRGMAINASGTRLFVAAPEKMLFGSGSGDGRVFVIDVAEGSETYGEIVEVLLAGGEPYGVSATNDANVMLYTNRLSDAKGVVIVKGDVGSYTQTAVSMSLGSPIDYFDVNNAISVVLSKDGEYAFVSGFNVFIQGNPSHDPNYDPFHPAGGNVGIIRDPLGAAPTLVAATRPVPMSWPDNLVLSPDGGTLYAAYRGQRVVMGFDVQAMIDAVNNPDFAGQLERKPIDDLAPSINVRSNFKIIEPGSFHSDPVFGVPPGEEFTGPIGVGGQANGLVAQGGASLELLAPDKLTSELLPTFSWLVKGFENAKSRLYVSTYRGSEGLFPSDLGKPDLNADRIFSSALLDANGIDAQGSAIFIKALTEKLKLTAGQQYFWGVEVVSPSGTVVARDWRVFKTEAYRDAAEPFSSVTLLTHGFQLSPTAPANVAESIAAFIEMAENIARAGGEGVAALYQKTTGRWLVFYNGATSETNVDLESVLASPAMAGKPVVLVSDWFNESDFPTNGFSEAAADALYSALARLNFNVGDNKLFDSPIHLIGHSRGTVVNSEIAQRFGIYAKAVRLSMTSLDVHDFNQPSLDIPVGEYLQLFGSGLNALGVPAAGTLLQLWGALPTNEIIPTGNFLDPDVQRWSNIDFAEHYYQILASNTALPVGGGIVSTPNGRFVPNFDVSINLNGRAGFTVDDGLATLTALSDGSLRPGGPHSRVWRWYGATTDLSAVNFDKAGEPVYRRLADKGAIEFQGVAIPWYNAQSFALGDGPSEGIGTGWAFSPQGGVPYAGTTSAVRIPVSFDNSETINPSGLPVPSVFNGDFEEGALNRSWLLQYSAGGLATNLTGDLPGWSFHGGRFEKNYAPGDRLIALANGQHAAMLDDDNSWIQHNRMVVPDWAEYLSFDVQVLDAGDGETLRVSAYLPDSDSWIFLGAVAIDSEGNAFVNRLLEVPVELRGAERMLKFSLSAAGSADAEILLDHVQFSRGLITDSTTDESDRGVFFTDTAGGLNSQWVELSNGFQDSFTVTVTTDPNDFLVFVDGAFETALNDNQAHAPLYENLLLNPGDSLHLDLKARFSDNFVKTYSDADLPIEKTALYFTITLANGSIRDEVVDLFYLPDFADGDAGDGVWTMMDTLDGKTRTLSFDNAAQVDVKPLLNQSGLFAVDVIGDIAQGIKYQAANPSAVEDFADYQIEEGGRNLGKIRVTARTVEKQTVGVSLSTLRTMVQAIRTEYEQWLADPTTPVHDADGFATGNYGTFVSLFSPLITDAEWAEVLTGFHTVFGKDPNAVGPVYPASIYLPSIEQNEFAYAENGLNPIVMINRPWVDVADNQSRSFAGIDFAYSSFESTLTEAGGGVESFGGKLLRDDISIPAKRFLLSQVVNPLRSGAMAGGKPMTLVVDGILRAYLNVGDTRQDVGESFGWVVGHELAHNLGLFDEYIYNPFQPVPRNGGDNFMSTANTITVADRQREALHLAMDNPETTVSLAGTNALATWYLDLDALDASNRPGRIALALAPGAGDGDPEADPLTALLAFVGMQGAATAEVISQSLLLNGEVHAGIVNGAFDVVDVTATDYGWMAVGQAGVANGQGVLSEDPRLASRLVQTFTVPEQAQVLRFELLGADFLANDDGPSDAFEVALLDMAGNAVAGTIPVANSDALFNLQAGGKVFAAASVSASGLIDRNGGRLTVDQPVTVSIDLSGIAAGTVLTLYFDLLGFSGAASRLRIDNVNIVSAADSGNLPPVASSSAIAASEEGAAVALGLSAPTDIDSPLLSILVSTLPTIGEVQHADGSTVGVGDSLSSAQLLGLKYLPPAEYKASDAIGRFSYSVSDGVSTVSGETVITLTAVNDAPLASSSAIVASEEGAAVALGLSAPTDVDSSTLSIVVSALPTIGELQYADGSALGDNDTLSSAQLLGLKYLPPADYNGSDAVGRFSYRVSDGNRTASGETTIVVTPVNDAPLVSSSAITTADGAAAVALGLRAPTDVDSPLLTIVVSALPTLGVVQYADGSTVGANDTLSSAQLLGLKYLPPALSNDNDVVSRFIYRVSDGSRSTTGQTTITVTPSNYAPVASSSAIVASEEGAAVALGLSAPSDVDSAVLSIVVTALPTLGVVQYADGSAVGANDTLSSAQLLGLKYLPPVEYNGSDAVGRFSYRVSDGQRSVSGETTISVTPVNDAPVASSSAIVASEEGAAVALGLSAPSDVDSVVSSIVVTALPTLGVVQYADGSAVGANDTLSSAQLLGLKYLPPAEYNGSDAVGRFSYRVSDGQRSVSGETTISVTPVNDAPVAVADSASVDVRASLLIDVLANDTDAENQALTLISVGGEARGGVLIENGKLRYTPLANGFGADRFSYLLADSEGATARGMVDVLVIGNHAPTLAPMADVSVSEGQSVTVSALGSDVDPGDVLSYSLVAAPAGASIDPSSGAIVWQALDGGSYDFNIRVADRAGEVASRSFTAKVLNVAPTLRLAGSPSIVVGEVYTLVLSSSDPGHDSINNWRIDWGDGQVIDYAGQPRQLEHRYSGVTGALQIRATATDEDGSYLVDPLPLTVLGRALPATPSSSDGNGVAVRFNDTFDTIAGFDGFDVFASGVTNAYASLAGSAGSAQQPRAIDLPFSLSTPGSLPPTLLAEQLRPAGDDAVRALPQIDFRPRPAGFRFPVGDARGAADDWRKSFVTNMARKSHDPNHDLRVRVRVNTEPPGQSLPLPEEFLDALPEATQDGSPNRARQGVPSGKPVILPEDAQELSLEDSQAANQDLESDESQESHGALERLMLALPLFPFGPTASRRSPKTRRSQIKAR
jgi:hypothetical protein